MCKTILINLLLSMEYILYYVWIVISIIMILITSAGAAIFHIAFMIIKKIIYINE